ncbi:MAG TPA: CPBP family intramembrane glutamic endopeptidase [Xanthobacteraceae bacterium]|nr:CPBP family intramembrane glutamic endopeptidase [Xanthobacteraceae bacterium]
MTDLASATPSEPGRGDEPKPLGIWATLGWAVLAFVVAQAAGIIALAVWNVAHGAPPLAIAGYDGAQIALTTLVINALQVALLAEVPRWRLDASPIDYLALTRFSLRNFLIGVIAIVAVVAAIDGFSRLVRSDTVTPFEIDIFTSGRAEGWLTAVIVAVVLVGPIGEEVLFRGFLFRGWVTPDWRGAIAVVVIPLLWAAMHLQYDWFGIGQVFLIGLVLSWIRWRSGSCLLTIALHVLVNLVGMVEVALRVGWPGT